MSAKLPDCPICRPMAEAAIAEGKAGWMMCSACQDRSVQEDVSQYAGDDAKEQAWRTARGLAPEEDRMVASALIMAAERDVLRRLLCAQLPGGESQYWALVEQELKR